MQTLLQALGCCCRGSNEHVHSRSSVPCGSQAGNGVRSVSKSSSARPEQGSRPGLKKNGRVLRGVGRAAHTHPPLGALGKEASGKTPRRDSRAGCCVPHCAKGSQRMEARERPASPPDSSRPPPPAPAPPRPPAGPPGNTDQKRSVSSPAPVTMVCPSGDMERYSTLRRAPRRHARTRSAPVKRGALPCCASSATARGRSRLWRGQGA